jgi:hypothetical protein
MDLWQPNIQHHRASVARACPAEIVSREMLVKNKKDEAK